MMKKKKTWLFVDLVEDKIKNRGLFITASLLFYVYITYAVIIGFRTKNVQPSLVESSLEFAHYAYMGANMSDIRRIVVKVTNTDGDELEGVNVTLQVKKITSDITQKTSPI